MEKFVVALQQDRCGDTHFFVLLPGGTENFSAELLNSLLKVEKVGGILVRGIGAEHPVRPQVIFQCLDSGQKDIRVLSAPVIHQDAQRKAVPKAVSGVKFQKIDHFVYPAQARQQVAEIFSGMEGKSQALKGPLIFQCKGFGVCVPSAFIDIAKHPSGDAVLQAGHVDTDKIAVNAGIAARIP